MKEDTILMQDILDKALREEALTREEIIFILQLRREDQIEALFETARKLRDRYSGNKVLLYGFIYLSTYCRNNCVFCKYRESNKTAPRYRKEENEIIDYAVKLAESGVHLIDLTMGEDPRFITPLFRLVERVKAATRLPVMISPGVVPGHVLKTFAEAGVDWVACYQETHDRDFFQYLRPGQSYDDRFNMKLAAHTYGMRIEEGILVGVGETPGQICDSIDAMRKLEADQVRAMNFIPQENTPMANHRKEPALKELIVIALLRLVFPGKRIPATLDIEGLGGLKRRLDSGANVVTSIVLPNKGLAGVASCLDIDDAGRTPGRIAPVLKEIGLSV